jgi:phospholipid/cholesterol/gamma-HCH transport system substrate-binding protein
MGAGVEEKVNYLVVGLFTLVLSAALIAGVLWLGTGGKYRKVYDTYYAYMSESVSGLNLNAPVKYRGVEVGLVREIALDIRDSERVRLVLKIERGTPIKENTVAILRVQGLTGIAYVELTGGNQSSPLLKARPGEQFPVIRTGPSLLARLDTAVTSLLTSLNRASDNINAMLDEDNRLAFKHSLASIEAVTRTLAARTAAIDAAVTGAARTLEHSAEASAELTRLLERVGKSADAVEKLANESTRAAAGVPDTLAETQALVADLRELSASLRRVSEQLERNPSALVFGRQPPKPGPGER